MKWCSFGKGLHKINGLFDTPVTSDPCEPKAYLFSVDNCTGIIRSVRA